MRTAAKKIIFISLLSVLLFLAFVAQGILSNGELTTERAEAVSLPLEEQPWTYEYDKDTDYYTLVIPFDGYYKLECYGAQGGTIATENGTGVGGKGGYVSATGYFTRGTTLYVYIGEAGGKEGSTGIKKGGGGAADPDCVQNDRLYQNVTSGGGSTDIRLNSTDIDARIMVAGGGGGAGADHNLTAFANGGAGGGTEGFNGGNGYAYGIGRGGQGGTLTTGNALFYGESNLLSEEYVAGWDCWCTPSDHSQGISLVSGERFGAGGGGYYGGRRGSTSSTDSFTEYEDGEGATVTHDYAAGGGGGSSYISGYTASGVPVCPTTAGYSFVQEGGNTIGTATGGLNEGNGYAKIEYVGFAEEYAPSDDIQTVYISEKAWYYISVNGQYKNDLNGYFVAGYVYLEEGDVLLIQTGSDANDGTTTVKAHENDSISEADNISGMFNEAHTVLAAGKSGNAAANFISGEPSLTNSWSGTRVYAVVDWVKEANRSSPVVGGVELRKASDISEASSFNWETVTEEEINMMTTNDMFTVTDPGLYEIYAWSGKSESNALGATGKGRIWLKGGDRYYFKTTLTEYTKEVILKTETDELTGDTIETTTTVHHTSTLKLELFENGESEPVAVLFDLKCGDEISEADDTRLEEVTVRNAVNEGNSAVIIRLIDRDTVAPNVLTVAPDRNAVQYPDEENGLYFYDDVTLSFWSSDEKSGVKSIRYGYYENSLVGGDTTELPYVEGNTELTVHVPEDILGGGVRQITIHYWAFDLMDNYAYSSYTFNFNRNVNSVYYHTGTGEEIEKSDYNIESPAFDLTDKKDPTEVGGLTFVGWYKLDGNTFEDTTRITSVTPSDKANRSDLHLYAKYTLAAPTVDDENKEGSAVFNVKDGNGFKGVSVPAFSKNHVLEDTNVGTFAYLDGWQRKTGDSWSVPLSGITGSYDLEWKQASGIIASGTYQFKERVKASITLTYTESAERTYVSDEVESGTYTLTVTKKPLSHADIVIVGANVTKTYTSDLITQTVVINDKVELSADDFLTTDDYTVSYLNNTNAGTAKTVIVAKDGSEYTGSVEVEFTIAPKDVSTVNVVSVAPMTFTGEQQKPTPDVSWNFSGRTIFLVEGEENDFVYEYGENVYVIGGGTVTIVGKNNYTGTKEISFAINRATPTLDVSGVTSEYTYTGNLITVDSGATIDNDEQTIVYSNNTFTTVAEGNGKRVKVTAPQSDNYLKAEAEVILTVNKATPTIDLSAVRKNYVYLYDEEGNGREQTVDEENVATASPEQNVRYQTPTFTDVPTDSDEDGYYFEEVAFAEASANYAYAETTFKIYVAKAEYDAQVPVDEDGYAATFTYDGTTHTFDDLVEVSVLQGAGITYTNNEITVVPNETGVHTVTITIEETRNFNEKVLTASVSVKQAKPTISTWGMVKRYVYDGTTITVTGGASVEVLRSGDENTIDILYENNEFKDVADSGNMTVRVRNKEGYYNYEETTEEVYITIAKAEPTTDALEVTVTYGKTLSEASGLPERADGEYFFEQDGDTYVGTVAEPSESITARFVPNDGDNWKIAEHIPVTVVVLRAERTIDLDEVTREFVYTGLRQYFSGASIGDNEGNVTYSPTSFVTVAEGNGMEVTVGVAQTANYLAAQTTFTATVLRAREEIDVSGLPTFTYDPNETFTLDRGATLGNEEQRDLIVYSANSFKTVAEAGSTVVVISAPQTDNYLATEIEVTPVMERATPVITYTGTKEFTYNGEQQSAIESDKIVLDNDEQTDLVTISNYLFTTVVEGMALKPRITVAQSANYKEWYIEWTITVEKAIPETRTQYVTVTYGKTLSYAIGLEEHYSFIDPTISVGTVAEPVTGVFVRYYPSIADMFNYQIVSDVPLVVTVERADPELSVSRVKADYVYTGETIVVNSGATINNDEQTIEYVNNEFLNVSEGNNRRVTVKVEQTDNYLASSQDVVIIMRRATPIIDISGVPTRYVYTGVTQTVEGATLIKGDGTITYSNNTFTTVAEGNAIGSVVISVASTENFLSESVTVDFVVEKAVQEIDTSVAEQGFVYTGARQTVTATVADREQTVRYENNTFTTVKQGNGMAVRFFVTETANYKANEKILVISVEKRTPETTEQHVEAYYGQILYNLTEKLESGYAFEQRLDTSVGMPDDPLQATVSFTPTDTENEKEVSGIPCTITVAKRRITVYLDNKSTVYGDEGYTSEPLTYSFDEEPLEGDDLGVTPTREEGSVPGEYRITATAAHDLYDVTIEEGVYVIEKRPLILDFTVKESYYGEAVAPLEYFIKEGTLYGDDTLEGELAFAVEPTVALSYDVVCNVTNERYSIMLNYPAVYTVKPRPITVYAIVTTSVYGDEPDFKYSVETAEGYNLTGEAMVEGDELGGSLYLESKNVGRQTILSGLFNANYDINYIGAYCVVTPKPITVTAKDAESVYGDAVAFEYEVTEGEVSEGDDLMAVLFQNDPNVGTHEIEGRFGNENYQVTFVTATHTVSRREVTIKLGDVSKTRSEYIKNSTLDRWLYSVVRGSVIGRDDLLLTITKEEGDDTGEYFLDATSGNDNYIVEVIMGVLTITKDRATIVVDANSLTVVADGREHQVSATVTSGATPEFFDKGTQETGVRVVPGKYVVRITAPETKNYFAPEAVEVTLNILQAEIEDEEQGVSVVAKDGFNAGDKLVVESAADSWDEDEHGELPEGYSVSAGYVIGKKDAKNVSSNVEGEISVTIKLAKRFAEKEKVEVALICDGRTVFQTVEVNEDGEITVTGNNMTYVAVIEKQQPHTLAILLIIGGALILFLFIGIMIKAGASRK